MKAILDKSDFSFDPANQRIVFSERFANLDLAHIGLITNVSTGAIVFQFNDPVAGGTLINGELTLEYNTTAMAVTDDLQIIVDVADRVRDPQLTAISDVLHALLIEIRTIKECLMQIK